MKAIQKVLIMMSQFQAVQIVVMSMTERAAVGFVIESTSLDKISLNC